MKKFSKKASRNSAKKYLIDLASSLSFTRLCCTKFLINSSIYWNSLDSSIYLYSSALQFLKIQTYLARQSKILNRFLGIEAENFKINFTVLGMIRVFVIVVFMQITGNQAYSANSKNLTVFCEPSISAPLTKIVRNFSQKHNTTIIVKFGSPFNLIEKIDAGEASDVFISANFDAIELLRHKGLVDVYNIAFIASDNLSLVTSKKNKNILLDLQNKNLTLEAAIKILAKNRSFLLIDRQGYSSSYFAEKLLNNIEVGNLHIKKKLPEENTTLVEDLSKNDKLFALTLFGQVVNRNSLYAIQTKENPVLSYQALAIAGSNMEVSREFLNFLKSNFSKEAFREAALIVN